MSTKSAMKALLSKVLCETEPPYDVSNQRKLPELGWDGIYPVSKPTGILTALWYTSFGQVKFSLSSELSDETSHGRLYYMDEKGHTKFYWLCIEADSYLTTANVRMAYQILNDCLDNSIAATSVCLYPTDWHVRVDYPLVEQDQGLATKLINLLNKGNTHV